MYRRLMSACRKGHINYIKSILSEYKTHDKNSINKLFILSCDDGYVDIIKYLIEYENINKQKDIDYGLKSAAYRGHVNIIKYLIDHINKSRSQINIYLPDENIFMLACINDRYSIIKYLIEYCKNICRIINIDDECIKITYLHCYIKIFIYLIEYGEYVNNKFDINIINNIIFSQQLDYYEGLKYLIYLNKHNYRNTTKYIVNNYVLNYIVVNKCIKQQHNKHTYVYIVNNIIKNNMYILSTNGINYSLIMCSKL